MRVLMLGWEFPPHISGGLGTACLGLTRALARLHTSITFILPRPQPVPADASQTPQNTQPSEPLQGPLTQEVTRLQQQGEISLRQVGDPADVARVRLRAVPAKLYSPYQSSLSRPASPVDAGDQPGDEPAAPPISLLRGGSSEPSSPDPAHAGAEPYQGDLLTEAKRYAELCVEAARPEQFDVIHAHDWLTLPAGMALASATGKPLIAHIHSTELDRSPGQPDPKIFDIERRGMHAAVRVIAVSHLTRAILQHRYGVEPHKIDVVYNGIEASPDPTARHHIRRGEKIVLYLGRITMQKGPEYFIEAARKVLAKYDHVKFVMAGAGDMTDRMIELVAQFGIGHKVLFAGFLRGSDVDRIFRMADLYVMPSVSEPFGLAPLEAISHDVPVIISRTSGVSEVIRHALKVDFWDTDDMADKMLAVLRHPPLSATLREFADMEVRKLTWDDAAEKCLQVYRHAMYLMPK